MAVQKRSLNVVASEIRQDWGAKVNFGAKPYLEAMATLDSIDGNYYQDTAKSIVAYFLCNAGAWRGDVARRVKKELNALIK